MCNAQVYTGDWWEADRDSLHYRAATQAVADVWGEAPLLVREGGTIPVTHKLETVTGAGAVLLPLGQAGDRAHLGNDGCVLQLSNTH